MRFESTKNGADGFLLFGLNLDFFCKEAFVSWGSTYEVHVFLSLKA